MKTLEPRGKVFFAALFIGIAYLTYLLIAPYLDMIIFSLIAVVMLKPAYDWFLRQRWVRGRRRLATTLTFVTLILAIAIPLLFIGYLVASQTLDFFRNLSSSTSGEGITIDRTLGDLRSLLEQIPFLGDLELNMEEIVSAIREMARTAAIWLANFVVNLVRTIPDLIPRVTIFLALLAVLLPGYDDIVQRIKEISPLGGDLSQRYLDKMTAMIKSLIKGVFVIALVQGVTAGVLFWIAGVPYVLFWILVTTVAAVIPLVGIGFVVMPVGLVLLFTGHIWQGLLVIGGQYLIIYNEDNVLRPKLVSKEAYLNFALVLLSVFGGMQAFGFLGLFVGPVIMILMLTSVEVYAEYYAREGELPPAAEPGETQPAEEVNG